MATITTKSTGSGTFKMMILDYKEALKLPFTIQDWTRIRAGVVFSYTRDTDNSNMDNSGSNTITPNSITDQVFMGLKKYSTNFPGAVSQEPFIGLTNTGVTSYLVFPNTLINATTPIGKTAVHGVLHSNGTLQGNSYTDNYDSGGTADSWDNTTAFSTLLGFDIEIVNKGQSNQQVIYQFGKSVPQLTTPDRATVESALNSITYTNVGTLDYNDGSLAYPLPDSFFVYLPFGSFRLRLHAFTVIRLS